MSDNTSKLIWASRILAAIAAIAAIIGAAKLNSFVTQFAGVATLIFGELARRVEQWLPQRSGVAELPAESPAASADADEVNDSE